MPNITIRTDSWQPDPELPDRMTLQSRIGDQAIPMRSTFGPDGLLLQQVLPDGTIIEPSSPETIKRYWDEAGLRME